MVSTTSAKKAPAKSKDGRKMKVSEGRVKKPVSEKILAANKKARLALAKGEVAKDEIDRKIQKDLRTLYVRFIGHDLPDHADAVKNMVHPDVKFVRIPRQTQKKIRYAFVEFSSEDQCENAKIQISQNEKVAGKVYVDFVGQKSRGANKPRELKSKKHRVINPLKLFISGLVEGMTEEKIKRLFPKCTSVTIPKSTAKKGTPFAFVQFSNAGDAKAAFDASQKLIISKKGDDDSKHHLTVVYAKMSKRLMSTKKGPKVIEKKTASADSKDKNQKEVEEEPKEVDQEEEEEVEEQEGSENDEEMENDKESDEEMDDSDGEEVENDPESDGEESEYDAGSDGKEVEDDGKSDGEEVENVTESSKNED